MIMDFVMHLKIVRFCKTINITKAQLIRQIYQLIKEHEGKDFNDINDLLEKLYPPRTHLTHKPVSFSSTRRKPRRVNINFHDKQALYETPSKDETH